jgi:hypothetical protein
VEPLIMHDFQIHTIESAPEQSKAALQGLQQNFGLIPNVAATMAGSPVLINAFIGAFGNFHGGTFDDRQKQVLLLTKRSRWDVTGPWRSIRRSH